MSEYICDFEDGDEEWYIVRERITRCRDCKHMGYDDLPDSNYCQMMRCFIGDEDFFCAWGVRKDVRDDEQQGQR